MLNKVKNAIPCSRLTLYLMVLALLPLFLLGYFHKKESDRWQELSSQIEATSHLALMKAQKQSLNLVVRKKFENANPLYIDQRLETLPLLTKEKRALEALFNNRSFIGNEMAEKRYAFIAGGGNRLLFAEKGVQSSEGIRETLEVLTHPVEVDGDDLKKILSLIEESQIGQPQLIISDFKLTKNKKASGNEVFDLTFSLIKREFSAL